MSNMSWRLKSCWRSESQRAPSNLWRVAFAPEKPRKDSIDFNWIGWTMLIVDAVMLIECSLDLIGSLVISQRDSKKGVESQVSSNFTAHILNNFSVWEANVWTFCWAFLAGCGMGCSGCSCIGCGGFFGRAPVDFFAAGRAGRAEAGARIQGKILNSNSRNSLKFVHHSLWHIRGHFKVKTWCPQDAGLHSVSFQTASSNHTNISPTLSLDLERLCLWPAAHVELLQGFFAPCNCPKKNGPKMATQTCTMPPLPRSPAVEVKSCKPEGNHIIFSAFRVPVCWLIHTYLNSFLTFSIQISPLKFLYLYVDVVAIHQSPPSSWESPCWAPNSIGSWPSGFAALNKLREQRNVLRFFLVCILFFKMFWNYSHNISITIFSCFHLFIFDLHSKPPWCLNIPVFLSYESARQDTHGALAWGRTLHLGFEWRLWPSSYAKSLKVEQFASNFHPFFMVPQCESGPHFTLTCSFLPYLTFPMSLIPRVRPTLDLHYVLFAPPARAAAPVTFNCSHPFGSWKKAWMKHSTLTEISVKWVKKPGKTVPPKEKNPNTITQ